MGGRQLSDSEAIVSFPGKFGHSRHEMMGQHYEWNPADQGRILFFGGRAQEQGKTSSSIKTNLDTRREEVFELSGP